MIERSIILHATTVSVQRRGAVLIGASGSGKSGLALAMMAFGAELVADDRTEIFLSGHEDTVMARAPETLPGLIEARGIGLLNAPLFGVVPVAMVVDLDQIESQRLPDPRETKLLDQIVPLLHRSETPYFASSLYHYLKYGRRD